MKKNLCSVLLVLGLIVSLVSQTSVTASAESDDPASLLAAQSTSYPIYTSVSPSGGGTCTTDVSSAEEYDTVYITATAADGYELSEVRVTNSDGEEQRTFTQDDGTILFYMPASYARVSAMFTAVDNGDDEDDNESEIISSIGVSITAPQGGDTVENGRADGFISLSSGNHYYLEWASWIGEDEEGYMVVYSDQNDGEGESVTFTAGETYYLMFNVKADDGYDFPDTMETSDISITGATLEGIYDITNVLSDYSDYSVVQLIASVTVTESTVGNGDEDPGEISEITLYVEPPVIGDNCGTEPDVSEEYDALYTITNAFWCDTEGNSYGTGIVFAEGLRYCINVSLQTEEGYVFNENLTVQLEGADDAEILYGPYTYAEAPDLASLTISVVPVEEAESRPASQTQIWTGNPDDSHNTFETSGGKVAVSYTPSEPNVYVLDAKDGTSYVSAEIVQFYEGDEFTVYAQADDGYRFAGWYHVNIDYDMSGSDGNKAYQGDAISTESSYTYKPGETIVSGDTDTLLYICAVFEEDTAETSYELTLDKPSLVEAGADGISYHFNAPETGYYTLNADGKDDEDAEYLITCYDESGLLGNSGYFIGGFTRFMIRGCDYYYVASAAEKTENNNADGYTITLSMAEGFDAFCSGSPEWNLSGDSKTEVTFPASGDPDSTRYKAVQLSVGESGFYRFKLRYGGGHNSNLHPLLLDGEGRCITKGDISSESILASDLASGSVYYMIPDCLHSSEETTFSLSAELTDHTEWCLDGHSHRWSSEDSVVKATFGREGGYCTVCTNCGLEYMYYTWSAVGDVTLADTVYTYDGKAKTPAVTVSDTDGTILQAENYTVTYSDNTKAGTATAKVTLVGDRYEGSRSLTFRINAKAIGTPSGKTLKYTGKAQTGVAAGDGYTVTNGSSTNAGTYTATVKLKDSNYIWSDGTMADKTVEWSISKASQSITAKAAANSVAVGKTTTISLGGAKESPACTYASSNTAVATVDKNGKVTAKKVGKVTITVTAAATTNYAKATQKVTINVVPAATSSVTVANLATGTKVTWKKVTGATGYYIYRNGSKIKTITSGSTLTYKDTKANTNGTRYTYKVVAYNKTYGTSTLSKSKVYYRVARPAISSVKNTAAKKMTVKWGKNAKGTGYQIQYSTSSTFASGNKTVTVTQKGTVSKVISGLTKGKTYYVRVRTYKTVSGTKYWSAWSVKKKVKIAM